MTVPRLDRSRRHSPWLAVFCGLGLVAAWRPVAPAAEPVVGPAKTREELLREWDLNSDGTIDSGEAEVAMSKMRIHRAELRMRTGIDPVTGTPRSEQEETEAEDPLAEEPPGKPLLPFDDQPEPATSGTASRPPAAKPAQKPAGISNLGGLLRGGQRAAPVAGGVRAGAPAARPGYGAAMPADLNAGRPKTAPAPVRGGLLPRPVLPPPPPRQLGEPFDPY